LRTHQEIDERSLALHRLVAEKIKNNPTLYQKAQSTLDRWLSTVDGSAQPYLAEWQALMKSGMNECLAVSVENSQRAAALRQSSPFCGILTAHERFAFLKSWRATHETPRA
jgi:hypothetical protein